MIVDQKSTSTSENQAHPVPFLAASSTAFFFTLKANRNY